MSLLKQTLLKTNDLNKCSGCGHEMNGEIKRVEVLTSTGFKQIPYCVECYANAKKFGLVK